MNNSNFFSCHIRVKLNNLKLFIEDVELRYADTEPTVLKGLNFMTRPREKIGIVGRTGAGKSSLITALFRLAEPTGSIIIDGVDVLKIRLDNIRSVISIIPQVQFKKFKLYF